MRGLTVIAVLLLAGCATSRAPAAEDWLVGTWLMMAEDLEYPLACASGLPITYGADGRFRLFGESGTWRLDGDRLIETTTGVDEDIADPGEASLGIPYTSRLEQRGNDEFRKTYADGAVETFRRCPAA